MALKVKENNFVTIEATCRDKAGQILDITGWSFEFAVQTKSGTVLFSKLSSDPTEIVVVSAVGGRVDMYIQAADTHFKSGTHEYEFKGTDSGDRPYTLDGPSDFVVTKTNI